MDYDLNSLLRCLPAVDDLLKNSAVAALMQSTPRKIVLDIIRKEVASMREKIKQGQIMPPADEKPDVFLKRLLLQQILMAVPRFSGANLRKVLNLTGVVLHTNLGRAVLAQSALEAMQMVASGYSNLETDLATGKRGIRYAPLEQQLAQLSGAESALVVNNNAAAVLLALSTLAKGKEVIVSRGQLVEIGGSFRIPDVMVQSGARLVEVGTTNKTYVKDYSGAVTQETALLLNVHTSNYRIVGFTKDTSVAELVALGRKLGLPVMSDLGSGSLVDLQHLGLPGEPTVSDVVQAGADVVTFSGDKLLGGPQAGIIVGKQKYIQKMKQNQLTRALRIDKGTVAALEATLQLYFDLDQAWQHIPTLRMLALKPADLQQSAADLCAQLQLVAGAQAVFNVVTTFSAVGGGALPTANLPSWAVQVVPKQMSVINLADALRATQPAVMGRLQDDKLLLDVRTLQPGEQPLLVQALADALQQRRPALN